MTRGCVLSRRSLLATASILLTGCATGAPAPPTLVLVIPSTHRRLATSPNFNYADLYALVADFRPDRVGVEIRPIDLHRPAAYLHHNYPPEMVALTQTYGDHVFGFDWLGADLDNRPIPDDWWSRQSPIKQLERACAAAPPPAAPELVRLNARLDTVSEAREAIFDNATAASLADGRYDRLSQEYYRIGAEITRSTPCQPLTDFYAARDRHIVANIVAEVRRNPGRGIAIVTGADHHGPVVEALATLGPNVRITAPGG